jgi:hypothetical protein
MMPKIKRKRLVVLALLAFFCCGAVVGVDWRRLGGGFLAFFKGRHEPVVVLGGRSPKDAEGSAIAANGPAPAPVGPRLATASTHRHAAGTDGPAGAGAKPDEDDLFKYGLPAAGGIPPGSFVVAQSDAPAGGSPGGPNPPGGIAEGGGPALAVDGVTSPAPGPLVGPTDAGLTGGGNATSSPSPSPAPSPASPAPAPGQPGGSDQGAGDVGATPPPPSSPVSTVPETSPLAMMGLGALFIAVAAARRRRA